VLVRRGALGLIVAALAPAARAQMALVETRIGQVAAQRGSVTVLRGPGIVALAVGDPVYPGDIVRTGPEARLLIRCEDGLQIAIGGGTDVAIHSYLADRATGSLQAALGLLRGIMRLIGGRSLPRQTIEVDTRTALASVRSTEWLVDVTERGTGVLAITGEVVVQALAGGTVVLQPGEGTDVAPGQPPRPPNPWGAARRTDAIARTTL
jgi:hypothetical protein